MLRNIIFDFGNVLFDLDLGRTGSQLQAVLGDDFVQVYARLLEKQVFELYEVGGLTTEEFVQHIQTASGERLLPEQIVTAWNAILLGMPQARFDMLTNLRKTYNVFLLSNINELHSDFIDSYLEQEYGITDFETRFFDGLYYSHRIRLRKPQPEAFEYVLADAELLPEETLFIDDLEKNIQAAQSLGIHARLHPAGKEIITRIEEYIRSV